MQIVVNCNERITSLTIIRVSSINCFVFCATRERNMGIGISESRVAGRQPDLEHPQLAGV